MLDETTLTFATDRTCLLMVWMEALAVAIVMFAEVSFMPWSFSGNIDFLKSLEKDVTNTAYFVPVDLSRLNWDDLVISQH